METFPDRLPNVTQAYQTNFSTDTVRTGLSVGKTNQRNKSGRNVNTYGASWNMLDEDFAFFKGWFRYTITLGNDWFYISLPLPEGLVEVKARFVNGVYNANYVGTNKWQVSATLETIIDSTYYSRPPEGVVTFNNTSGQGASVSLGDLSSEVPDSFTVEFFVENFSCGSRYCRLFHTTEIVSSATRVALSARNGNDIYGAGTYRNFPSTKQKIVIVYDSTTNSKIEYINGQNNSVSGRPSGIDSWWIGTSPSSPGDNYYIAGDFSEIGIYNYAKDATQVASESTQTPSLSDTGITRYYTGANDGTNLFEYVEGDHGIMNNFL